MNAVGYSIIIPVYNEAARIAKNIDAIFSFFAPYGKTAEILFVNDGSQDDTGEVLELFRERYRFRIIGYPKNLGKGHAVRQGVLHAKGAWVVFFDVDLAVPLEEFQHFLSYKRPDDQILIGSRRLLHSKINKGESAFRTFLGYGFTVLSRFFVPGIRDFTCGFKCFSKEATKTVFSRARVNRWAFDAEILYIAKLHGIPIVQMPVAWAHDSDSRVRVFRDVCTSLAELARILLYKLLGRYR